MAAKDGISAKICREARKKYGKDMPAAKLARIVHSENPLHFKTPESVRSMLRYIEGKRGEKMRSQIAKDQQEFIVEEARSMNPYLLPQSDAKEIKPVYYRGYKRAFVFADVHLPYHDIPALTTAFDYAKKEKPDLIVIDGDLIDCHKLSRFVKDPKKRDFAYELDQLKMFFISLHKAFPKAKKVYKLGNHELRYEHFLFEKAKELIGVEEFELRNIIQSRSEGIDIVDDKRIIMLNELPILHGHEFGRGQFNPVNTARGLFLKGNHTALQADSHRGSKHKEPNLFKKSTVTWSIGCLCGLWPEYAVYNKWDHGFAMVELDPNKKNFEVRLKDIENGKVY